MPQLRDRPLIYSTAQGFLSALESGDSLFTPGQRVWSQEIVDEIVKRVYEDPRPGSESFFEKLSIQLNLADRATIQGVAEAILIVMLQDNSTAPETKTSQLARLVELASPPIPLPASLQGALTYGIARMGPAAAHRPHHLRFVLDFAAAWMSLRPKRRAELKGDPWAFREFVTELPAKKAKFTQLALMHLVHPNTFEPILSSKHKGMIARAFADEIEVRTEDPDRDLLAIRESLAAKGADPDFHFYRPGYKERWAPASASNEKEGSDQIHLLLRWAPQFGADTLVRHREVIEEKGFAWWGKIGDPAKPPLSPDNLLRIRSQLDEEDPATNVYLVGGGEAWRADLHEITTDESHVDKALIPATHGDAHHHLWLRISGLEQLDQGWLTQNLSLAKNGKPLSLRGQSTLILVTENDVIVEPRARYFALAQRSGEDRLYPDEEGRAYHFHERVAGYKRLVEAGGSARFVYYRPKSSADDTTAGTFFGAGRVTRTERVHDPEGDETFASILEDYRPFTTPAPLAKVRPSTWNVQHSIIEITESEFDRILAMAEGDTSIEAFDLDLLARQVEEDDLIIDRTVLATALAALESGKHIVLTGPPGTAKTTLAQAIARAAAFAGRCDGHVLTTATSDWTTYETIGGLKPSGDELRFAPGHFLTAIEANHWLVIDEFNRSNFDRAFGQLFTVLSGQSVDLPYVDAGSGKPIVLLAQDDGDAPPNKHAIVVPKEWRIIATMNVFDKSLLFEMSFALMRRFAFIEVPAPEASVYLELVRERTAEEPDDARRTIEEVCERLLKLRAIKEIGPALYMDIARFMANRLTLGSVGIEELTFQVFYSFLLPQFEGITDQQGTEIMKTMKPLIGSNTAALERTLSQVLGVHLPTSTRLAAAEDPLPYADE